jgi:hypothetical protein
VLFVLAVILAVILAYYLAEPLTRKPQPHPDTAENPPEHDAAASERELLLQDLKELELDYAGGKIPEAEYLPRKEQLLSRLAALPENQKS